MIDEQMAELAARLRAEADSIRNATATIHDIKHVADLERAAGLIESMAQRNEPLMKLIEYADLADDSCYGTVSSRVVRDLANEALGIRQGDAA